MPRHGVNDFKSYSLEVRFRSTKWIYFTIYYIVGAPYPKNGGPFHHGHSLGPPAVPVLKSKIHRSQILGKGHCDPRLVKTCSREIVFGCWEIVRYHLFWFHGQIRLLELGILGICGIYNNQLCLTWVCLNKGISPKTETELGKNMIIQLILRGWNCRSLGMVQQTGYSTNWVVDGLPVYPPINYYLYQIGAILGSLIIYWRALQTVIVFWGPIAQWYPNWHPLLHWLWTRNVIAYLVCLVIWDHHHPRM